VGIDTVKVVAAKLIRDGHIQRGYLGVGGQNMALERSAARALNMPGGGVLVQSVEPSGPAAAAGVRAGDVIIGLDGETVAGIDDLHRVLSEERIGRTIDLTVLRDGAPRVLAVTPEAKTGRR
jgi:S1-C subfamily serine protease